MTLALRSPPQLWWSLSSLKRVPVPPAAARRLSRWCLGPRAATLQMAAYSSRRRLQLAVSSRGPSAGQTRQQAACRAVLAPTLPCRLCAHVTGPASITHIWTTGATALYLGSADLTPLPKGAASAAGFEVDLPAGLFAMRGNYRGDDDSAASWSLPINVSSGLASHPIHQKPLSAKVWKFAVNAPER